MQIVVADLLKPADLTGIRDMLGKIRFADGRATAGPAARQVKNNEQAREGASLTLLREKVGALLLANPIFELAVRPKALTPLLFARYGVGKAYGTHIDNPIMHGLRTDVSFTLFLADPESYDGGELVIESAAGEESFKLAAGSLILYPTHALHRVEAVTRGERIVCVGWAQSWVRDAGKRELLFDLDSARHLVLEQGGKNPAYDLLAKTSSNLVRLWAE
jgi:PKHD-type hydroxylase